MPGQRARRILVTGPDDALRESLVELLRTEGHRVLGARGVEEALGAISGERPEVIVVETRSRGGSAEGAREDELGILKGSGIPVVVLAWQAGAPAGALSELTAVVTAPFELDLFLALIDQAACREVPSSHER